MNNSFYGGRKGESFVIAAKYNFISADMIYNTESYQQQITKECQELNITKEDWIKRNCMKEAFAQGNRYEVVNYDEFVIIDSPHKSDLNNGKIYRRGYNYQDPNTGGGIYIGQIVGPSGLSPNIELSTIDKVKNLQEKEGFEYQRSEGAYNTSNSLVPGKVSQKEQYNDEIKWVCCSVRDEFDRDTIAYIGFTFPYLVIDYVADSVDPYFNRDSEEVGFNNINLMERKDDGTHPYYEKWHISIPQGIKGDTFKNFRIIEASSVDNVQPYEGQADDRKGKANATFPHEETRRKILVYDYYHYDKDKGGEPVTLYLGDANNIEDIALDNDGTVRISYSHDDDKVWKNKFKWIDNISITQQGLFTVNYNYGGEVTKYQTNLAWIDKVNLIDNGTLTFTYNNGKKVTYDKKLKWITGVDVANDGTIQVDYNNGTGPDKFIKKIKWINTVTLAEDGTLTFSYNNGTQDTVFAKSIQWIKDIQFDEKGTLKVLYNNDTPASVWEKQIKWIKDIDIQPNGTVVVSYNNDSANSTWSNLLKWITKVNVSTDGTISFTYNNTDKPDEFKNMMKWISNVILADNGTLTVNYNNGAKADEFINKIKWITNVTLADDGQLTMNFNNGAPALTKKLRWITGCSFTETGAFQLTFNDGTPAVVQQIDWVKDVSISDTGVFKLVFNNPEKPVITRQMNWVKNVAFDNTGHFKLDFVDSKIPSVQQNIKWINNVKVNDKEIENQKLHIEYNDGTNTDIGQPINYIMKMIIEPVSYHLLVLYSDPMKRGKVSYAGRSDWYDMGCVKSYDGILIGTNYSENHFKDNSIYGIITQLNKELPNGFPSSDIDKHGKIITVGNSLNNKRFFAFDYNKESNGKYRGWYFLGDLGGVTKPGAIAGDLYDENIQAVAATLPTYSLWFIVE